MDRLPMRQRGLRKRDQCELVVATPDAAPILAGCLPHWVTGVRYSRQAQPRGEYREPLHRSPFSDGRLAFGLDRLFVSGINASKIMLEKHPSASEGTEHEAGEGQVDDGGGVGGSEDPAAGLDDESLSGLGSLDDLRMPFALGAQLLEPLDQFTGLARFGPDIGELSDGEDGGARQRLGHGWRMGFVLLFLSLTFGCFAGDAQRADALSIDGIYEGTIGIQLDKAKGKEYNAPAKLVFMPDGKAAILTAQHPDGVVSIVMKGGLRGSTFVGESKGKLDYGGYHYGMRWDITFDPKKRTAVLHGKAVNLPKWARDDDLRYTFRKKAKR